jgi:plastocyanin
MTRSLLALLWLLLGARLVAAEGAVRVVCEDEKHQRVADAVVWFTRTDAPEPPATPPAAPVAIVQRDQEFEPYVTPILVGTKIAFPNRDTVQHHVYSLSPPKRFEIPLYSGDAKETVTFDRPGIVTLGCNIHDWMAAYVVVLTTPHFAKSGADGTALVAGLPAGRYKLEVWHPRLAGQVEREIVIATNDADPQVVFLVLKPDRRIRRAPDAAGNAYR